MTVATAGEAQMLRRRALWFRQFGEHGAPQDRATQDAMAEQFRGESVRQQQAVEAALVK